MPGKGLPDIQTQLMPQPWRRLFHLVNPTRSVYAINYISKSSKCIYLLEVLILLTFQSVLKCTDDSVAHADFGGKSSQASVTSAHHTDACKAFFLYSELCFVLTHSSLFAYGALTMSREARQAYRRIQRRARPLTHGLHNSTGLVRVLNANRQPGGSNHGLDSSSHYTLCGLSQVFLTKQRTDVCGRLHGLVYCRTDLVCNDKSYGT